MRLQILDHVVSITITITSSSPSPSPSSLNMIRTSMLVACTSHNLSGLYFNDLSLRNHRYIFFKHAMSQPHWQKAIEPLASSQLTSTIVPLNAHIIRSRSAYEEIPQKKSTLWSRTTKNPDVSTGPLAHPFAHPIALLTAGFARALELAGK